MTTCVQRMISDEWWDLVGGFLPGCGCSCEQKILWWWERIVMVDLDEVAAFARAVGNVLRTQRQRRDWSLDRVGQRVGLSVSGLARVELGARPADMARLVELCAVLGVSPALVVAVAEAEVFPLGWPGGGVVTVEDFRQYRATPQPPRHVMVDVPEPSVAEPVTVDDVITVEPDVGSPLWVCVNGRRLFPAESLDALRRLGFTVVWIANRRQYLTADQADAALRSWERERWEAPIRDAYRRQGPTWPTP